jgi:hypothetical protein
MFSLKNLFVCQSLLLAALSASAMEMKVCGNQVILSGAVEADDFSKVETILTDNPTIKIAVLRNSPGGDALSGYKTGALFREKGITTYVSGYCRSSCSRFFLGGAERYFTDGKANEDLVDRWVSIPDRRGYVYFYHPEALKRNDGVSTILCHGRERCESRWNASEKISPKTVNEDTQLLRSFNVWSIECLKVSHVSSERVSAKAASRFHQSASLQN